MKKLLVLLPLLFLLTGCGGKAIYGEVHSVTPKGEYIEVTFVGKDDTVLADDETIVFSFSGIEGELLSEELIQPYITAYDLKWTPSGYYSDRIYVESVILPKPYILEDGTKLTIRKDLSHTTYFSPDGIDILREQVPFGPHNVSVGGLPTFDMLNPQVQKRILSHYEKLDLQYDLDAELESAWQSYQTSDNKLLFQSHLLSQEISPTAANDQLLWYGTYVTRPIGNNLHHTSCIQTIFDRETGNVIDTAALFTHEEKEVGKRILEIVNIPEADLKQEMETAFRFEYLNFHGNALDVCFPAGSLPSQTSDHMLGVEYTDLTGYIHTWAIPDSIE